MNQGHSECHSSIPRARDENAKMRKNRTEIEEHVCKHLTIYMADCFGQMPHVDTTVIDRPDFVCEVAGRRIAAEFSQIPSHYIIKHFYKRLPSPTYRENDIDGRLGIYPFEPHRWVHDALLAKSGKTNTYRKRSRADELWLVLHAPTSKNDWPMSKVDNPSGRKFEMELLRFGTKGRSYGFDRVIYVYADGSIVGVAGNGEAIPKKIELADNLGYPAVTWHSFGFNCRVPLPGLGLRIHEFKNIRFRESIIVPRDDWMNGREPYINRPEFFVRAMVGYERTTVELFTDDKMTRIENIKSGDGNKPSFNFFSVLEQGIRQHRYRAIYK